MRAWVFIGVMMIFALPAVAEIGSLSKDPGNDTLSKDRDSDAIKSANTDSTLTVEQRNSMLGASQLRCWQDGLLLFDARNVAPGSASAGRTLEFRERSTGRPYKLFELNETLCVYEGESK